MPLEVNIDDGCSNCKEAKHELIINRLAIDRYKPVLISQGIMTEQQINMILSRTYGDNISLLELDQVDLDLISKKLLASGNHDFILKKKLIK